MHSGFVIVGEHAPSDLTPERTFPREAGIK
jgi:hypothetical protein